jgi:predicted transcriptional regulator
MPQTNTMTLRLTPKTIARLEGLAKATDRTKAFLAGRAIEEYLDLQEWQVSAIREAVREADRPDAEFLSHDTVVDRMLKLRAKAKHK